MKKFTFCFNAYFDNIKFPFIPPEVFLLNPHSLEDKSNHEIQYHIQKIKQHLNPENSQLMLPIFSNDWSPVLSVRHVVFALELFLCDPPPYVHALIGKFTSR